MTQTNITLIGKNAPKKRVALIILLSFLVANFFITSYILVQLLIVNKESSVTPMDSGLVLYFHFNNQKAYGENNTFVHDFSGNNHNGNVQGAQWNATGGIGRSGAFEFSNLHDAIQVEDSNSLSPSTFKQHFTVSFFGRFTNSDFSGEGLEKDYSNYLGKGSSEGGYEWVFRQYNSSNIEGRNNRLSFYAFNREGGLGAGSYVQEKVTGAEWVYITGVINGTHIILYKNGLLQSSNPLLEYNIRMENGDADFYIGSENANYFNGSLDELRIYNRSLNDSQVQELYNFSIRGESNEV